MTEQKKCLCLRNSHSFVCSISRTFFLPSNYMLHHFLKHSYITLNQYVLSIYTYNKIVCMCVCECALLQENGITYSYQISYEDSRTPEYVHLRLRFSILFLFFLFFIIFLNFLTIFCRIFV